MKRVVFVAPSFRPSTMRFANAVASVPDMALGVITGDHLQRIPEHIRTKLKGHFRVNNCLDPGQLAIGTKAIQKQMGGVDRIFTVLEEMQGPVARVRDYLNIPGMGHEAATNFRDKSQMKEVLRNNGVPCAQSCLVARPEQAWAFVEEVGFPLVVKPPAGAGARNTFQIDGKEALQDYLAVYAPSQARPALFEEFIQGDEYSFEAISIRGKVVWHSLSRYYPNPLEVLENPWIQWCVLLPRELDHPHWHDIRNANAAALNALGMHTGLSHMEWFRRKKDGSVAISEVGARPPGAQFMTIMSYAHDKDFYKAWAELMIHERFEIPERKYAAGAAFLRGAGQGRVKAVHGLRQAQEEVGSVVVEAKLPQIGEPSRSGYEGHGYVIVRHPETEVVKKVLQRLVSLIRVTYE